jgi:tetratricopeptide (TPR) repeat protein
MELVKGVPITRFCDERRLTPRERLELFIPVCQAVQHAHQKGVIHRDLKPSNVLVALYDGHPVPKVIDFGVAKATGPKLTDRTLYTEFGSIVGTLEYMSPEQAELNQLDIDTRSDIYSLGVLLYELLTGSTPLGPKRLKGAAILEMLRVIREEESPRPSLRLSTTEELPSIAACRGTEPRKLSSLVRGELDWIVMKALAKERERRYATATGVTDDIERYLNHEPVSAGPPTAAYRLRKFVRRNRVQVTAAALVLMALVLGIVGTTLGLIEARRRRLEAERRLSQVTKMNEILGSIFRNIDPRGIQKDGKELSVVLGERLDRATEEIEGEATGDPIAVARMQIILGSSQHGLGYSDRAIRLFSKARATLAAALGPDHPETLASMSGLATSYWAAGQNEKALKLREETLALRKAKLGPDHPDTLTSMSQLATSYWAAGQNERALELYENTLALQKAKLGPDDSETLKTMRNLATSYSHAGQFERALRLRQETLALWEARFGPDHADTLAGKHNLAISYIEAGQNERAQKLLEESLRLMKAKLGLDHPLTLTNMNTMSFSYAESGQEQRALKLREDALALYKVKLGRDHPDTLTTMNNLAISYQHVGQFERALKVFEETLELKKAKLGPNHPDTVVNLEDYALCLADTGQFDRAEAILDGVIASRRAALGEVNPDMIRSRMNRAEIDLTRGRLDAAEASGRTILADCRTRLGNDDRNSIFAGLALARVREARGERAAAAPLYRAALESARKNPADRETLATALMESGRSRLAASDWSTADAQLRAALAIREGEKPQHWQTAEARSLLGGALLGQNKAAEAAPLLRSGYEGMARSAAAIPIVNRARLAEALDRLIAAGEAAGTKAELAAWKAERAKLGAGGPKP